jgi:NTP pyrophosphatase (non-canonical NTP hydrolase)
MSQLDLKATAKAAHLNAKAHGFYDEPPSIPERLCLVHSEISEALECYRDGEMELHFDEKGKPLGFPSELADIIIRLIDFAEYLQIDVTGLNLKRIASYRPIVDELCALHATISIAYTYFTTTAPTAGKGALKAAIADTFSLANYLHIDIDEAITVKMKYNESRPYKHGRKVL